MKLILSASWFMLSVMFLPACNDKQPPHFYYQHVAVSLDPAKHLLSGKTDFSIRPFGTKRLLFGLAKDASVLSVTSAEMNIPFTFSGGTLAVDLPARFSRGEFPLSIVYRAYFNDTVPRRIVSTEDPTYGVTAVIGSEGAFLGSDAGWYPEPAAPVRTRTVTITTPSGFEAITAGELIFRKALQESVVSSWKVTVPGESLSLSAGPYIVRERNQDGIALSTYFYKDNASLSGRYLDAVAGYLKFYQDKLGPYPFKKFAVVENFLPTGYGFPSYTLFGSAIIRLPFIVSTSLPHEIAHCWWGNGVLVDFRQGNWSEGLVTYLADYMLKENKSPRDGRDYRVQILSDYAALVSPGDDFPVKDFSTRVDPASRSIGYGKSAMIFHMIRRQIGDKAFFQSLREIVQDKMFKEASWSDFTDAFSVVSGKDLLPFMNQWLNRPGGPRLALREVVLQQVGDVWQVKGVIEQKAPFYSLEVPLQLETSKETIPYTVPLRGERASFALISPAYPKRLLLDPGADLFRIIPSSALPPSVNRIKGSRDLLVVVTDNCRADREVLRQLLESMGQSKPEMLREDELSSGDLKKDLLLCGVPRRNDLVPQLPPEVSIRENSFSVDGVAFSHSGDALFVVGRHPLDSAYAAGLFLPLSKSAAAASSLKITHYGKFSYLAFTDGENRGKGTLPLQDSDAIVTFSGAANE